MHIIFLHFFLVSFFLLNTNSKKNKKIVKNCPYSLNYYTADSILLANQCGYDPGHKILISYNVLVQAKFAASKMKLDIYYDKFGIRVAPQIV